MSKITREDIDRNQYPDWAEFTPESESQTKVSPRAGFRFEPTAPFDDLEVTGLSVLRDVQVKNSAGTTIMQRGSAGMEALITQNGAPAMARIGAGIIESGYKTGQGPSFSKFGSGAMLPECIHIGSQVIYPGSIDFTMNGTWIVLLGAYDVRLLGGIFDNVEVPTGYSAWYSLSAQSFNSGAGAAYIGINHVLLAGATTWSGNTFRAIMRSGYFKSWNRFPAENAYGYNGRGLNLYVYGDNTGAGASIWSITVHGCLVKSGAALPKVFPDEAT